MDAELRFLERKYQQSGTAEDLINLYAYAFRGPYYQFFDEALNSVVERKRTFPPAANSWGLQELSLTTTPLQIFLVLVELKPPSAEEMSYDNQLHPKGLTLYFYTLSASKEKCPYCQAQGPHLCQQYVSPSANLGHPWTSPITLPIAYPVYGLDHPELEEEHRDWNATKPRLLSQEYRYVINQWTLRGYPVERDGNITSLEIGDGWHLHKVIKIGSRFSSTALHHYLSVKKHNYISGLFRKAIKLDDIVDPIAIDPATDRRLSVHRLFYPEKTIAVPILDARHQLFPIDTLHDLPEKAPFPKIGPCPNFEILPKGGQIFNETLGQYLPTGEVATVFSEGPIPHAEMIIDTTTTCGHGHNKGMPLCPPTWSDTGKLAAIYCDSCNRMLPPDHKSHDAYHRCDSCWRVMKRSTPDMLQYLRDYLMEEGEGKWYWCELCEENEEGTGYHEEDFCEWEREDAEEEGREPKKLKPIYRCPSCAGGDYKSEYFGDYSWYQTPQEAMKCCTEIEMWDWGPVLELQAEAE